MPSLTDKLRDLGVQVGANGIFTPEKINHAPDLVDHLPGSWEKTSRGDCFVVRKTFPASEKHGTRELSSLPSLAVFDAIPSLAGIAEVPLSQILFIDTETTGLSGGAGTYVFLIGTAKIVSGKIEFVQFFLQDPASEASQLAALENFAADTRALVSYNGKSFDLPRINNRYLFHGWPAPFSDALHMDLLHIARRLWKDHLPGCTLGDLEHHLLGVERESLDIPGWQVSEKFFEYLQTRDPRPLEGVFYHNEIDVLSLISLLGYMSDRLTHPTHPEYRDLEDLLSIGNFFTFLQQDEAAVEILNLYMSNRNIPSELKTSAQITLASLHKKRGDLKKAVKLWKRTANKGDIQASIELAMYYEHQLRDYQEAIHWTLTARDAASPDPHSHDSLLAELTHRLARLKRKSDH